MDMNILQQLGLVPPGGDLSAIYNDPNAGAYAQPPQAPIAQPPAPVLDAPPTNILQDTLPPPQAPVVQAAPDPAPAAPRPRHSVLDVLGRAADVFAKVGGAQALYQPTIDARQDRVNTLADHVLETTKANQEISQGAMNNTTQAGKMAGQALRGVQALVAANPQVDVAKIWPLLAAQAGVDPAHIQEIGATLQNDPTSLDGLASTLNGDPKEKYSGQVIYGRDKDGNLKAFQASQGPGDAREVTMPAGYTPVDPQQFINTGGAMVGVGKNSGNVQRIIPVTQAPDKIAQIQSTNRNADNRNATQLKIAAMPARGKAGAGAGGDAAATGNREALIALDILDKGFQDLHSINALPGDKGGAIGNVLSAIGRTGPGDAISAQFGGAAAQKRIELNKTVSTLQQTLLKALPASATRTKFEQEILKQSLPNPSTMSLTTAQHVIQQYRDIYKRAQAAAAKTPAAKPATASPRVTPRAAPQNSGWGKATVVQ